MYFIVIREICQVYFCDNVGIEKQASILSIPLNIREV
jgi:hypothetical protein